MRQAPPRNCRELFDLFLRYTQDAGVAGMLDGIDFAGVEPRQVYFALHARAPERRQSAVAALGYSARDHLMLGMRSEEFRKNLLSRFLDAFPEKQRLLFIHIPKTAGTELANRFIEQYPYLSSQISVPGWMADEEVYKAVHNTVSRLATSERLFVCGHNTLEQYRRWRAIRFEDRIFATLRDPALAAISQVNYILRRIFADAPRPLPDTVGWRRIFDVQNPSPTIGKAAIVDLARRILRNQDVVPANVACGFLGDGTADNAIERVICHDVELTDTHHLNRWCRETWGIDRRTRSNESVPYFAPDNLSTADKDHIATITEADARLHAMLVERMARTGAASVRGIQFA